MTAERQPTADHRVGNPHSTACRAAPSELPCEPRLDRNRRPALSPHRRTPATTTATNKKEAPSDVGASLSLLRAAVRYIAPAVSSASRTSASTCSPAFPYFSRMVR